MSKFNQNRKPKEQKPILCPVSKESISQILQRLSLPTDPVTKNMISTCIRQNAFHWLENLANLFKSLDINHSDFTIELKNIAGIYKALIMLADPPVTEAILSDKFYKCTFGALENLPELQGKLCCREFFEKVEYKEIVPINNENIVKKIHICYRINYLRETIFAKDEGPVVQSLAFMSFNCSIEILNALLNNVKYL